MSNGEGFGVNMNGDGRLARALASLEEPARELAPRLREEGRLGLYGEAFLAHTGLSRTLEPAVLEWLGPSKNGSRGINYGIFSTQFEEAQMAGLLLDRVLAVEPLEAVAWLRRVLSAENARGHLVARIGGYRVDEPAQLAPGISVVPSEALREGSGMAGVFGTLTLPAASFGLKVELPEFSVFVDMSQPQSPHGVFQVAQERARSIVSCLAMLGGAPQVQSVWFEYIDPDLSVLTERGGASYFTLRHPDYQPRPTLDAAAAGLLLGKYDALTERDRRTLDVALDRLVRSRIDILAGDKALDAAIALEALFGDKTKEEVGYRLRLRAALFLEADIEAREALRSTLARFYSIRSAVAHGNISAAGVGDAREQAAIDCGLDCVQRAAVKVCEQGRIPKWARFELGDTES